MLKKCKICGELKTIDNFKKAKTCKDGYDTICKKCYRPIKKIQQREYRKKNLNYYNEARQNNLLTWKKNELLQSAKRRAKSNGLDFELDKGWIEHNIEKGCALSGLPFEISLGPMNIYSPSIDRIDNSIGYTKINSRMILFGLNAFKCSSTDEEMLKIMGAVYEKPR